MRIKSIMILLFLIIVMSFSVVASEILDDFNDNSLDTTIWKVFTNTDTGNVTINETNSRLEFSGNYSNTPIYTKIETITASPSGVNAFMEIELDIISMTYDVNNHNYIWVSFGQGQVYLDGGCGVYLEFNYRQASSNNVIVIHEYPSGSSLATLGDVDLDKHTISIDASQTGTSTIYTVFYDDVVVVQDTQAGACANPKLNVSIAYKDTNVSTPAYFFVDNFIFRYNEVTNGTGSGCSVNSDCESGKCQGGFCVLKSDGEPCISNSQCISGECTNDKCAKTPLWDKIDYLKDESYGDDSNSNNLIAILLMCFISGLLVVSVAQHGGGIFAGVIGVLSFVTLAIFFTIVGWLSPFILLGIFFIGLVIIVLAFVIGGGGTN